MPKTTRRNPRAAFGLLGMAVSVIAVLVGGWGGSARRSHHVSRNVATARVEQLEEISPSTEAEPIMAGTPTIPSTGVPASTAVGDPAARQSVAPRSSPSGESGGPSDGSNGAGKSIRTVRVLSPSERPLPAVVDAPPALGTRLEPLNVSSSTNESRRASPITTMTFDQGTFPDLRPDPRSVDAARQSGATLPSVDPPARVQTPTTTSPPLASTRPSPSTSTTAAERQGIVVRTISATAAAFVDPCTRKPMPKGCGRGLNATVLGQHRVNEPYPQVSLHGGANVGFWDDCAEQLGNVDDDPVAVIASNVPLNRMQAQLIPTRDPHTPDARAADPSDMLGTQPRQTAARLASWDRALRFSEPLPSLGSCIRIPRAIADKYAVNSNFTFSVKLRATTRTGRAISTTLAASIPTEIANTNFSVELTGITPRLLRTTTRFRYSQLSKRGSGNVANTVVSVGLRWNVPCSAYDPTRNTPAPLTRQFGSTAYESDGAVDRATIYLALAPNSPSTTSFRVCTYIITWERTGPEIARTDEHWATAPQRARYEMRLIPEGGLTPRDLNRHLRLYFNQEVDDGVTIAATGFQRQCGQTAGALRLTEPRGPFDADTSDRWCTVRGRDLLDDPGTVTATAQLWDGDVLQQTEVGSFRVDPRSCLNCSAERQTVSFGTGNDRFLTMDLVRESNDDEGRDAPYSINNDEIDVVAFPVSGNEWNFELPPPTQSGPRTTTSSGVVPLDTDPARTFTHLSFPSGATVVWTGKEALQATRVIARLDGSSSEGCDIDSVDREVGTDRGRPLPVAIRGSIQLPELCRNHRYDVLVAFRDRRGMVAVYASHPRLFDDLSDTVTERRVLPNLAVELDSTGRRVSATVEVSMPPELRGQPFSIRSASVELNGDDVVAFPQPNVALLFGPTDCAAPRRVSGPAGGVRARAPGQVHLRATIIVKVGANCETARTLVIQRDELITISNNVRSAVVTLERPDGMRALVNVSWP